MQLVFDDTSEFGVRPVEEEDDYESTERTYEMNYETTYHRDGTVTLWDVYKQQWERVAAENVSDEILASLTETERSRIGRMAERARGCCTEEGV